MRSQRLIAASACLAIVLSIFAGCGDDAGEPSGSVDAANTVALDAGVDASEAPDTSDDRDARPGACERNEHVVAGECLPCPAGTFNIAGDRPEVRDTSCKPILCSENERVLAHECVSCPPGTVASAGADASQGDTQCATFVCSTDEHVVDNECVPCESGTTNMSGDDSSGPDTECDAERCPSNQRVVSNACVSCEPGTTNDAGDDTSGPDTTCEPIICGVDQRVASNACVSCEVGMANEAGDDASGQDTACVPVDHCADETHTCSTEETCVFTGPGTFDCVPPFISTWTTTNFGVSTDNQIQLPLVDGGTYDFTVDWGDGNSDRITAWNQTERKHTYAQMGNYTIKIRGTISGWGFEADTLTDAEKIIEIDQWGVLNLGNAGRYFQGAKNLTIKATDELDLSGTRTMFNAFYECESLTTVPGMENWDVSSVTSMSRMFQDATLFNQDISSWDVSNVFRMNDMFQGATAFNQDISQWDVSKVTSMSRMFQDATAFNQDLSQWDVSNVLSMNAMFRDATAFNQDISQWDVSKVSTMEGMFAKAMAFNQDLSQWTVSNVTNMRGMFFDATAFNQDISSWDVSNVGTMQNMFNGATAFNQNLSQWNVSNVGIMDHMFARVALSTSNYDALLNGWSTQPVQNFVNFSGGNSKYSSAASAARQSLINDHNWSISDDGLE